MILHQTTRRSARDPPKEVRPTAGFRFFCATRVSCEVALIAVYGLVNQAFEDVSVQQFKGAMLAQALMVLFGDRCIQVLGRLG